MTIKSSIFRLALLLSLPLLLPACGERGRDFSLNDYRGKWLILNYWAAWCGPCREEIAELNQLQRDHSSRLTVLAVNFDRVRGDELQEQAQQLGIAFSLLEEDPADTLRLARPAALPTSYLFDSEGRLAAKLVGPQTAASLLLRIDALADSAR